MHAVKWGMRMTEAGRMIDGMSDDDIRRLSEILSPSIVQNTLNQHRVWGEKSRLHVGQGVSLVDTIFNTTSGDIHIADFVFFGHGVSVLTGTHAIDKFDALRQTTVPQTGRDIIIKQGAWISSGSIIVGPCCIGRNAVIGVGSVVLGDVQEGWFYAGSPARAIKPVSSDYALPRHHRIKLKSLWDKASGFVKKRH